jgi:hypothetical protein
MIIYNIDEAETEVLALPAQLLDAPDRWAHLLRHLQH